MEFPEAFKKYRLRNFQGLIKSNVEFPEEIKKKSRGISRGLGFRPYNFLGV